MNIKLSKREISVLMACLNRASNEKIYEELKFLRGVIKDKHICDYSDIDTSFTSNIYNKLKFYYKKL